MKCRIGDRILYGALGVMEIVDIVSEGSFDNQKTYYVLKDIYSSAHAKTYVPTDNERLSMQMYPLLDKNQLLLLLDGAGAACTSVWSENNRERMEEYRAVMESGDRTALISLIKSVEQMGRMRSEIGKKNYISDEDAKRRALRLLSLEAATVLSIPLDEAESLIKGKILT